MNVLASVAGQGIKCARALQLFTRALQHIWASIRDSRGRGGEGWGDDDDDDDITMSHGARRGHLQSSDGPRAKVCLPGFLASGFLVHNFFPKAPLRHGSPPPEPMQVAQTRLSPEEKDRGVLAGHVLCSIWSFSHIMSSKGQGLSVKERLVVSRTTIDTSLSQLF